MIETLMNVLVHRADKPGARHRRRLPVLLMLLFASVLTISCTSSPRSTFADAGSVRIMVLGEDYDRYHISRSSVAFERVMVELQEAMHRRGFEVVDEEAVSAELGFWWTQDRRKVDLFEVAQMANASETARNRVRAVATFSIEAAYRSLSFTNRFEITVRGRLYDVASNRFLGSFDLPTEVVSGPLDCHTESCGSRVVGDRARDIATSIGAVLSRRLAKQVDRGAEDGTRHGLDTSYTLTMRHLSSSEALQVISVMAEEFPGYKTHELMRRAADLRSYAYTTTAPAEKLERWLHILLLDMGMRPDEDVEVYVRDGSITIERVDGLPPVTEPRSGRFN